MEDRNCSTSQMIVVGPARWARSSILHPRSSILPLRSSRRSRCERGFSFAEVMFAVVILGIGFIMVAAIFPVAIQQTQANGEENVAALAARDAADAISSLPSSVTNPAYVAPGAANYQTLVSNNPGIAVQTYPAFPPTVKNYILGSQDGSVPGAVAPPAVVVPFNGMRWQLLQSNSIQISDTRFAYVPFYRRENGSAFAELIVIAVAVRNNPTYVVGSDALNTNNSQVNITLTPNTAMGPPPLSAVQLQQIGKTSLRQTAICPDTITFTGGTPAGGESANLAVQMPTNSRLIGRSYTCGFQINSTGTFELNPGDGMALTAGYDGNWGTPNRTVDPGTGTTESGYLLSKATLQPQVAYAILTSTPNNPAGEITLYSGPASNTVPAAAVPGAFVIIADDYPYDPNSSLNGNGTAGSYSYNLLPNNANPASANIPPYAVGTLNGRIFRLASVASDLSPSNGLKRFNLDPAYGMRPAGNYVESPDAMPGQSIMAAANANRVSPNQGSPGGPYDPNSEQFRVKVYIVGAATSNGTALGSAQDIGVFATYFQVK
jgi:type II secretory pathway pseudopilin PulG